jgi:hypothetical protein
LKKDLLMDAIPIKGLVNDFEWFKSNLDGILQNGIDAAGTIPVLHHNDGEYARFVNKHVLNLHERVLILLGLCQYLDPSLCNKLIRDDNHFRLVQCKRTGVLIPTAETFLILVSGNLIQKRIVSHHYLGTEHLFYRKSVINVGESDEDVAPFFGALNITPSFRELFLYNRYSSPRFNKEFPAHLLETHMGWEDLIMNPATAERLEEIKAFLDHGETLRKEWGLSKHMKQGYRCLFYGPSGTGKTLAATLLGKHIQREVYRVDLSTVISKYIGETSKNLNALFNTAEDKNWILFFDEGDALFGKRVDTAQTDDKNAHFANQDIAFLLQRIENYNGLIIVASNFRKNMDDAFSRRFQSIVHFDILKPELRKQYWLDNLPSKISLSNGIDLEQISKIHPFSPASIINIINRVSLQTIRKNLAEISAEDLDLCIKDELIK